MEAIVWGWGSVDGREGVEMLRLRYPDLRAEFGARDDGSENEEREKRAKWESSSSREWVAVAFVLRNARKVGHEMRSESREDGGWEGCCCCCCCCCCC